MKEIFEDVELSTPRHHQIKGASEHVPLERGTGHPLVRSSNHACACTSAPWCWYESFQMSWQITASRI